MSKTEYAWVIQDCKSKEYARLMIFDYYLGKWGFSFVKELYLSHFFKTKKDARSCCNNQNSKPVKVKIEIVGEDDE